MASPSDSAAYLTSAFVMWFLMMVAMMLPSAAPMILLYSALARRAEARGAVLAPTSVFAGAYLAVWGGFSALAALAQWLLVRSGAVSEISLALGSRRVGGALLIAAACIRRRRSSAPVSKTAARRWRGDMVAPRRRGRGAPRLRSRGLLPGMLRDVDGASIRFRGDEPCLGRGVGAAGPGGEGLAARIANSGSRRRRVGYRGAGDDCGRPGGLTKGLVQHRETLRSSWGSRASCGKLDNLVCDLFLSELPGSRDEVVEHLRDIGLRRRHGAHPRFVLCGEREGDRFA